jgi:hypothetical protein
MPLARQCSRGDLFMAEPMQKTPGRLRRLARWFLPILLITIAGLGWRIYTLHRASRDLQDAIAETDRLDPIWQLEDLDRQRFALPQEQNAALHMQAAFTSGTWPSYQEYEDQLNHLLPLGQIDPQIVKQMRTALKGFMPAANEARKALPLPTGWYKVEWSVDGIGTQSSHFDKLGVLGARLNELAMLHSQDGKDEEAWQTALTILAAARSLGEEPLAGSQLQRMHLNGLTVRSLERCLAQGTVSDTILAEAQRQLTGEARQPLLFYRLRGHRAVMHLAMTNFANGKAGYHPAQLKYWFTTREILSNQADMLVLEYTSNLKAEHAWMLRYLNNAVENSKLSAPEMLAEMRSLQSKADKEAPPLCQLLLPSMVKFSEEAVSTRARLDCAVAAIGVERYRLKNQRWPNSLKEVVDANLLDEVPIDGFNGKPLNYRKTTDGVVIFSVGPLGNYSGTMLDEGRPFDAELIRHEFRLWDR